MNKYTVSLTASAKRSRVDIKPWTAKGPDGMSSLDVLRAWALDGENAVLITRNTSRHVLLQICELLERHGTPRSENSVRNKICSLFNIYDAWITRGSNPVRESAEVTESRIAFEQILRRGNQIYGQRGDEGMALAADPEHLEVRMVDALSKQREMAEQEAELHKLINSVECELRDAQITLEAARFKESNNECDDEEAIKAQNQVEMIVTRLNQLRNSLEDVVVQGEKARSVFESIQVDQKTKRGRKPKVKVTRKRLRTTSESSSSLSSLDSINIFPKKSVTDKLISMSKDDRKLYLDVCNQQAEILSRIGVAVNHDKEAILYFANKIGLNYY